FRNSILGNAGTAGSTSSTGETGVGSVGRASFQTGNWYASMSPDYGATFKYVNPYTQFPTTGEYSGGFCCDQRVANDTSHHMTLWYLQYVKTGTTANDTNGVRLAAARSTLDLITNSWIYYNITPQTFNLGLGKWLDFPHLQVSNNFVYGT